MLCLDQAQAGIHQTIDAKPHDDLTSQGLQAAGVSQNVANGIDTGASIVFTLGGGAAAKGVTAATERAAVSVDALNAGRSLEQMTTQLKGAVSNEIATLRAAGASTGRSDPRSLSPWTGPPAPCRTSTSTISPASCPPTGRLPHTTRAALTGLRKKRHAIARDKRGDATCHRIAEEA